MSNLFSHITIFFSIIMLSVNITFAAIDNSDEWKTHEQLTNRLSSEWYRVGILQNDLEDIKDLLTDLTDFEIYPQSITGLTDENIVKIDRAIEKTEKSRISIQNELNSIKQPLGDDIEILREMAAGETVESMFDVLIEGDMLRISELIKTKHKIDNLRNQSDSLLSMISSLMNIKLPQQDEQFKEESDFIQILTANLGLYSEVFYQKINNIKNQLAKRSTTSDLNKMYKVEIFQIKKTIDQKLYRIADRKLSHMLERYNKKIDTDEIYSLIASVKFGLKNYYEAINNAQKVKQNSRFINHKDLIMIQSWYFLDKYTAIIEWEKETDLFRFSNKERNLLLWLTTESHIKTNPNADHTKRLELIDMESDYAIHVLHAIGRSYFNKNQYEIALSILKKAATKEAPGTPEELKAFERAKATLAQILFETKDYKGALEQFFSLINSQDLFEEALFGMSWCYIKLNSFTKAEATLKKLINQSPESTESAEALLVMARRFINKANHEWEKIKYLSKEEKRVQETLKKIISLKENAVSEERRLQAQNAEGELRKLYSDLISEKRLQPNDIDKLYRQALRICEIITKNYETGSFKEFSFSEQREQILYKLDSLSLEINNNADNRGTISRSFKRNILQIKAVVKKSDIVETEFLLDHYNWKIDSFDWIKKNLRDTLNSLASIENERDSIKLANIKFKQNNIKSTIDSIIIVQNQLFEDHYENITYRSYNLLKTDLSSKDESFIRYNLGELLYKKENQKFTKEYAAYEKKMAEHDSLYSLYNDGKLEILPLEPERPNLSHKKSIEQFTEILQKFPDDSLIFAHRYSLAWCYNDLAKTDSAVHHMTILANKHPSSQYAPQAWMYLGEYYFDNAKLDQAVASYKNVMHYPDSRWFDNALYKLAWTQYRLSNPEKAISSFLALVDLGKGIKGGKALLENESIDYIAISFSESDVTGERGLQRAKIFCRKLDDEEKGTKILHRLASVYEEQGRFNMAIKSYETLLTMYPNYHKNPQVESDLIAVMSREIPLEKSNMLKMDYFKKYNRESTWAKKQTNKSIIKLADSTAARQLYDASVTYHRLALEKNDTTQYNSALDAYKLFIHYYPKDSKTNECHYNMAEILFSTGQYHKAAEEYIAVSKRYPDSKYRETAAWNAIVASQTLLRIEKENMK